MSRVTLEIYDLKNNTIIYSQNVTGIDQEQQTITAIFIHTRIRAVL